MTMFSFERVENAYIEKGVTRGAHKYYFTLDFVFKSGKKKCGYCAWLYEDGKYGFSCVSSDDVCNRRREIATWEKISDGWVKPPYTSSLVYKNIDGKQIAEIFRDRVQG